MSEVVARRAPRWSSRGSVREINKVLPNLGDQSKGEEVDPVLYYISTDPSVNIANPLMDIWSVLSSVGSLLSVCSVAWSPEKKVDVSVSLLLASCEVRLWSRLSRLSVMWAEWVMEPFSVGPGCLSGLIRKSSQSSQAWRQASPVPLALSGGSQPHLEGKQSLSCEGKWQHRRFSFRE